MDKSGLIREALRGLVARESTVTPQEVEDDVNIGEYGVGSAAAVSMMGEMEMLLDTRLSPTMIYEKPTIEELAEAIEQAMRSAQD